MDFGICGTFWLPVSLCCQGETPQNFQKVLGEWVFPKIGVPPNNPFVHKVFHYKPSILGYHYFWKHLNGREQKSHG